MDGHNRYELLQVANALLIGPRNCEAAVGLRWAWIKRHAARLGVRIFRVGGKPLIDAEELISALKRDAEPSPPQPTSARDELAALLEGES